MRERCLRGHLLTPENVLYNPSGARYCKLCAEIREIRNKRGTRQPKFRLPGTPPPSQIDPKFLPGKEGSLFGWTYELGDLPAWKDDPFALVGDETGRVLAEIAQGREFGASRVDRLAGQNPALEAILLVERKLDHIKVPKSVRKSAASWARRKVKEEQQMADKKRRDPPVPGVNQIAYRIAKQVAEMETPEFRKCVQGSPHEHHLWSRGKVEDKYWCPGVEIPDSELIATEEEEASFKARYAGVLAATSGLRADAPVAFETLDEGEDEVAEPVHTSAGWLVPSRPSHYFRGRKR